MRQKRASRSGPLDLLNLIFWPLHPLVIHSHPHAAAWLLNARGRADVVHSRGIELRFGGLRAPPVAGCGLGIALCVPFPRRERRQEQAIRGRAVHQLLHPASQVQVRAAFRIPTVIVDRRSPRLVGRTGRALPHPSSSHLPQVLHIHGGRRRLRASLSFRRVTPHPAGVDLVPAPGRRRATGKGPLSQGVRRRLCGDGAARSSLHSHRRHRQAGGNLGPASVAGVSCAPYGRIAHRHARRTLSRRSVQDAPEMGAAASTFSRHAGLRR